MPCHNGDYFFFGGRMKEQTVASTCTTIIQRPGASVCVLRLWRDAQYNCVPGPAKRSDHYKNRRGKFISILFNGSKLYCLRVWFSVLFVVVVGGFFSFRPRTPLACRLPWPFPYSIHNIVPCSNAKLNVTINFNALCNFIVFVCVQTQKYGKIIICAGVTGWSQRTYIIITYTFCTCRKRDRIFRLKWGWCLLWPNTNLGHCWQSTKFEQSHGHQRSPRVLCGDGPARHSTIYVCI